MVYRIGRADRLLIAAGLAILVFVLVLALGASWGGCHNPHAERASQQYANYDDCTINGVVTFSRAIGTLIHEGRDDLNAFSTAVIAAFTVVLALVTRRQAVLTKLVADSGKESARAAVVSAHVAQDMARDVERPYVFLTDMRAEYISGNPLAGFLSSAQSLSLTDGKAIEFSYKLQNHGRTPAIIILVQHEIGFVRFKRGGETGIADEPPKTPEYNSTRRQHLNEVIGTGPPTREHKTRFFDEAINETGPFRNLPIIYGYIEYRDVSRRRYRAGFGFAWIGEDVFYPYSNAYNYDEELTETGETELPEPPTAT